MSDPLGPTDPSGRDLLDERMDARLKEHGARWRDALPEPVPVVEPATRAGARPARPWLVPAAAAAAVALVLGVSATLTRGGDDEAGPAGGPSSSPTSDDTCGPGDLVASSRYLRDSGDDTRLSAVLTPADGTSSCLVTDFPRVELLDHGVVAPVSTTHAGLDPGGTTVISRSDPAIVELVWRPAHSCAGIDNDTVRITVGDGATVEIQGFGETGCGSGDHAVPLRVNPLEQVSDQQPPETGGLRITVTMDGGPDGRSTPVTSGTLTVDNGSMSSGMSIGPDAGPARLELPPGDYDVTVSTPQWNDGAVFDYGTVHVTSGDDRDVHVSLPVR